MTKYRKKPIEVEAIQFDGSIESVQKVKQFTKDKFREIPEEDREDDPSKVAEVFDYIHRTWIGVRTEDWIIRGVSGEVYPCAPGVFEATYEEVK